MATIPTSPTGTSWPDSWSTRMISANGCGLSAPRAQASVWSHPPPAVPHLGRSQRVVEPGPGQADDGAVGVGMVTADGDQAADVRLVRAVAAVRPEPDRADVAFGQVVAGQLGPGHG